MTTENLPAEIDQDILAKLRGQLGGDPNQKLGDRTPVFKVNYNDEEDLTKEQEEAGVEPRKLPKGHFVMENEDGVAVYAKTATIRVLGNHFQYSHYDNDANKMVSQTILVTDMRHEMIDDIGSTRCGMPGAKGGLSDEQKKLYKDVKASRQLRVLVSMKGKDVDGKDVEIDGLPALWRLGGVNFMPFDEQYVAALPKGSDIWDYPIELSTIRRKNGSTTYYEISFKPDFSTKLPLTADLISHMQKFADSVDAFNKAIITKHEKALRKRQEGSDLEDLGSDLEDDLGDEIPF